jgi:N-acetyl sugar amidotransferase
MDTSDPDIRFDADGVCNHCSQLLDVLSSMPAPDVRRRQLERVVQGIREHGRRRPFDCVLGVSGGVDSSYVVHLARSMGLRPVAVHLDNGWDSELAVNNIERLLKNLDVELRTDVLDWDEFRDLQRAMLRASVPDVEIPTDHAIIAVLYQTAARYHIPIITGTNVVTEGILPTSWTYGIGDWKYISGIHAKYGSRNITCFPHFTRNKLMYYTFVLGIESIAILDYVEYSRDSAIELLKDKCGWRSYGGKHHESIFTRFLQGYILPRKFGIDKRRAHLSTLICSGQTTRDKALEVMNDPPYPDALAQEDLEYVTKKLGFEPAAFLHIMSEMPRTYRDYPTYLDATRLDTFRRTFLWSARAVHRRVKGFRRSVIPVGS